MAAPRVRRRGLTQRDRLTLTVMTLGTVLVVVALVLFNGLKPAPTEFGDISAVAAGPPASPSASASASASASDDHLTDAAGQGGVVAIGAPTTAAAPAPTNAAAPAPGTVPSSVPSAAASPPAPASPVPEGPTTASPPAASSAAAPPTGSTGTPPTSPETAATDAPVPDPASAPYPASAPPGGSKAAVAQSISIPVLGVTAPIHPVGSTDGVVDVPENPAEVGFYSGSVLPGSPAGSTVLVGHVNYANVPGALIGLTEVHEGDTVQVATLGGEILQYRITAREVVLKSEGLPSDLFVTDGPPRLVLITCGGPFDTVAQRYEDNVVVVATPIT